MHPRLTSFCGCPVDGCEWLQDFAVPQNAIGFAAVVNIVLNAYMEHMVTMHLDYLTLVHHTRSHINVDDPHIPRLSYSLN